MTSYSVVRTPPIFVRPLTPSSFLTRSIFLTDNYDDFMPYLDHSPPVHTMPLFLDTTADSSTAPGRYGDTHSGCSD